MEQCFYSNQLNPSRKAFDFEKGFETDRKLVDSQTTKNSDSFISAGVKKSSNDPLFEKILSEDCTNLKIINVENICGVSSLNNETQGSLRLAEVVDLDERSSRCSVKGNSLYCSNNAVSKNEEKLQKIQKIEDPKESFKEILQGQNSLINEDSPARNSYSELSDFSGLFDSENRFLKRHYKEPYNFDSLSKEITKKPEILSTKRNKHLPMQSNKSESPVDAPLRSTPVTPRANRRLKSNEIERSILFEQKISVFNFESDLPNDDNETENSLPSIPATPGNVSEHSSSECEVFQFKGKCTPSDDMENTFCGESAKLDTTECTPSDDMEDTFCGESTKLDTTEALEACSSKDMKSSYLIDEQKLAKEIENKYAEWKKYWIAGSQPAKNEVSDLKSSNISQHNETSGISQCLTECDPITKSNSSSPITYEELREDSSSPLLTRKKRKRDVFQETDCEEDLQTAEDAENSVLFNGQKQYTHQTYISDEENSSSYSPQSGIRKYNDSLASDFELMMQKKRAEKQKSRKRGNDFITANDELIVQLIDRMEEAAYEDRRLNKIGLPAIKKVCMLKYVISQLRKKDLQSIFLEHNVLVTLNDWLSPLPSKCLPCLQIRESILRLLLDFPRIDARQIRHSRIGRTLKFLREHPDETKENKERCNLIIEKWTRPPHDLNFEYRAMTKRERQQRDYELSLRYAKPKSKTSSNPTTRVQPNILDINLSSPITADASRPGEPGWVPRARVPQLSVRDYINRPESKLECEILTKLKPSRFDILSKKYHKAKRDSLIYRSAAKLSIVGDKM